LIQASLLAGRYSRVLDRESAYEQLQQQMAQEQHASTAQAKQTTEQGGLAGTLKEVIFGKTGPRGGKKEGLVDQATKQITRKITNQITNRIVKTLFNAILGSKRK